MTPRLVTGVAAAAGVTLPAFSSGAYFPSEWGLLLLAPALVVFAAAAAAAGIPLGRLDSLYPAALGALAAWQLLSVAWSPAPDGPVLEAERTLAYAAVAAALLLVLRRQLVTALLGGLVAGTVVVAGAGLGNRLLTGELGDPRDPVSGIRLDDPIGYANAVGILTVLGGLLAAGLAPRVETVARAAVAAALVPLASALAFTASRGSVVALGIGVIALLLLEWERARALAGLIAIGVAPAAAAALSLRSPLADPGTTVAQAQAAGDTLLWQLAVLTVAGGAAGVAARRVSRALAPYAVPAAALGVVAIAILAVATGARSVADDAVDRFEATPAVTGSDVRGRLLSRSSSGRSAYWRVAWQMAEREPVVGEGAGSYERWWLQQRPVASYARDAHNLYLETLAELGPVGLALLVVAIATPLVALRRRALHPAVPAAGAAYAAFLAHAGVDWDWEIPAVTLVAVACGAVLLVVARAEQARRAWTPRLRAAGVAAASALLAVALVAHVGNRAAAASEEALAGGDAPQAAAEARRAAAWQPWAAAPERLLGEAELARGRDAEAAQSLRRALRRDPESWRAWYGLASVTTGRERLAALRRAERLNPLSPELAGLRAAHTDS